MRFPAMSAVRSTRTWFFALFVGAVFCGAAPAAQAAFGVESFFAGNCKVSTCTPASTPSEYFTQAAGHPNFGISDFTLKTKEIAPGAFQPEGVVSKLRVDVPAGLSTNPQAIPMCSAEEFNSMEVKEGVFLESACSESTRIGTNFVTVLV